MENANGTSFYDSTPTPLHIQHFVQDFFGGIDVDPCAEDGNRMKAATYYTAADDGLTHSWGPGSAYVHPPKTDLRDWLLRAAKHGREVGESIVLAPWLADNDYVADHYDAVAFLTRESSLFGVYVEPLVLLYKGKRYHDFIEFATNSRHVARVVRF